MPVRGSDKRLSETKIRLTVRIKPSVRDRIDRAAKALGMSRSEFMADAALRRAADVLGDRVPIIASPEAYAQFLARLDAPPAPNERLQRTMRTKAPWDVA